MYDIEAVIETYGEQIFNAQLMNEAKYKAAGMESLRKTYDKHKAEETSAQSKLGSKFIAHCFADAVDNVKAFMEKTTGVHAGCRSKYAGICEDLQQAYKDDLNVLYDMLTYATFSNMLSAVITTPTAVLNNVVQKIAVDIQDEYNIKAYVNLMEMESVKVAKKKEDSLNAGISKRVQANYKRVYARNLMRHNGYEVQSFNSKDLQALCAQIVHIIADCTGYFVIGNNAPKGLATVEVTDELLEAWNKNEQNIINNAYKVCPCVIPPREWTSFDEGGYYGDLQKVSTLIRLHDSKTYYGKEFINKLNQTDISNVLKAVNGIQATSWKINTDVLDVVLKLVEKGGNRAKLPNIYKAEKPVKFKDEKNPTPEEKELYMKLMPDYYKNEARRAGIVLRMNSTLRIAQDFAEYDKIWFPYNMDFRGRVYPLPSFSPQGSDLDKALLLFADVPPFKTEEDVKWLAIHTANVAGNDKCSFDDRIKWVEENMDNILESAEDPISTHWWDLIDGTELKDGGGKKPLQVLAACLMWKKLKEHQEAHNGSSIGFECGIPIAMDGTCSGLQIFSAILRDNDAGASVNLVPSDVPSDIYRVVADKVNIQLKKDAVNGTPDTFDGGKIVLGTQTLAQKWLKFGVTRGTVKRNTMTLAYGSREYGFREQIMEDVIEDDWHKKGKEKSVFTEENRWKMSAYMAKLVWNSVNTTVVKAMEGMKWLQACSRLVAKNGQVVTWETPMGLPVQQSYMKTTSKSVQLRCAGKFLRLYENVATGEIDKSKQASGIAPNFIHSMDAAVLQAITCKAVDAGIKHFAMIHDSYGVPASQTGIMYKLSRQSFVELFTKHDVLEDFARDMQALTDKKLPAPPSIGTLDLNCVLDSKYIFS